MISSFNQITRHWAHEKFEFVCLDKLEIFFSDFDTVKCVYPTTYIQSKSLKDINDPMLFVKWFKESGTAIITGLRQRVEIYKDYIEKTIGSPQNVTQIPPPSPSKWVLSDSTEFSNQKAYTYICQTNLRTTFFFMFSGRFSILKVNPFHQLYWNIFSGMQIVKLNWRFVAELMQKYALLMKKEALKSR